jgi:fibronectin type 3 domain-containing protein
MLSAAILLSCTPAFCAAKTKAPKLKASNKASSISLKWNKIKGAKKYTLMYKSGSGSYKKAYSGNKTKFTFKKPKAGKSYTFKVKADSSSSKAFKITFLKKIKTVTAAEQFDMSGILVKWSKTKGAKSYKIYRSVKSKNSFSKIATVKANAKRQFLDTKLKSIESYKYYVVAINGKSKSAKSAEAHDIYGYYDRKTDAPLTLTIKKGEEYKDIYEKLDRYFATGLVSWKSLNTKIVKVDAFGIFTGVKKGTATVLATVKKGTYKNKTDKTIKIIVTVK